MTDRGAITDALDHIVELARLAAETARSIKGDAEEEELVLEFFEKHGDCIERMRKEGRI